jgi:hypothetical protein
MAFRLRRILNLAGTGLAMLGMGFVAVQLWRYGGQLEGFSLPAGGWLFIAGLMVLYGGASALLALAWRGLLGFLGVGVGCGWAVRVYGLAQIAK